MSRPPACKNCGSTEVKFRQAKGGHWYLVDTWRGTKNTIPHQVSCPKRKALEDKEND